MAQNKNDLISIVIPLYNVGDSLSKCIESIIKQTYKNIEIILVDDGSTDSSYNICDEYAQIDKRIVVIHKENEGVSVARNIGIEVAKGKYITFVDSDDLVTDDYIEYLYNMLIEDKTDMSICNVKVIWKNTNYSTSKEKNRYILNSKEALERILLQQGVEVAVYAKLYKAKIFDDIRFPIGKTYEDTAIIYKLIEKCNKISYRDKECYYYIARVGSISKQKQFNDNEKNYIEFTNEMLSYIREKYKDLDKPIKRFYLYSNFRILRMLIVTKPRHHEFEKEIIKNIKNCQKEVFFYKKTPKRDKIAIICLNMGVNIFKLFWIMYLKITGRII